MSMFDRVAKVRAAQLRMRTARHALTTPAAALLVRGRAHPLTTVGAAAGAVTGEVTGVVVGAAEGASAAAKAPFTNERRVVRTWKTETTTDGRTIQVPVEIEVDEQGRPLTK